MSYKSIVPTILVLLSLGQGQSFGQEPKTFTNSIGMKMIRIEPGSFVMGVEGKPLPKGVALRPYLKNGDFDESPRHKVTISKPFYISETEITVEQYKKFKSSWPGFKAKMDYDPYACGISWHDAVEFCKWLSINLGKEYRLCTEAEWEYVCRAGTDTPFSSGMQQPEHETANAWGVKNMHTGVLEWCYDWHALYSAKEQTDPVGPSEGFVKVVRGGGLDHVDAKTNSFYYGRDIGPWPMGLHPFFYRSANRGAIAPAFAPPPKEYQALQMKPINPPLPPGPQSSSPYRAKGLVGGWHHIGFRVVQGPMPQTKPSRFEQPFVQRCVKQKNPSLKQGPDLTKPYYRTRRVLLSLTQERMVNVGWKIGLPPGLGTNQHNGALIVCDNGDLIACYYNGFIESDPDMSILLVRLRYGSNHWDIPSPWPDFLDGNDASPFIFVDAGTIWLGWGGYHMTAAYPFRWTTSTDNGATWAPIQFPVFDSWPGGYGRRQPINSSFKSADGTLFVAFDGWGSTSGLWATKNNGKTWFDAGGRVLGLHGTFAMLDDDTILAYGTRNRSIDGFCPKNVSTDLGKTWTVSRSAMPAQGGGDNPIMIKLDSGRLLYISNFGSTHDPNIFGFSGPGGYVCLSDDEGDTWQVRKLIGAQTLDDKGQPVSVNTVGYVGADQAANGIIHIVTSRTNPDLHIELNEEWILSGSEDPNTQAGDVEIVSGTVRKYEESYRNGKAKAIWSAGIGTDGQYLLEGDEVWYYPNGNKQWQVLYKAGDKVGAETYYNEDESPQWRWEYLRDGKQKFTVWDEFGKVKAKSIWKDRKILNYELSN